MSAAALLEAPAADLTDEIAAARLVLLDQDEKEAKARGLRENELPCGCSPEPVRHFRGVDQADPWRTTWSCSSCGNVKGRSVALAGLRGAG